MKGLVVTVSHPDFEENDDHQRAAFIDGLAKGWVAARAAHHVTVEVFLREDEDEGVVEAYFGYGEDGLQVRQTELAAAAFIATCSYGVLMHNRSDHSETMPIHSFDITRNVDVPSTAIQIGNASEAHDAGIEA